MDDIPEDFYWDAIVLALQCDVDHLVKELLPLPLGELDSVVNDLKLFPSLVKKNISYYQRLEFEKSVEHLPIKILWIPTAEHYLLHYFNACKQLKLRRSVFKIAKDPDVNKDTIMEEVRLNEKFYDIFDKTADVAEPPHLHGYRQAVEGQEAFNANELDTLMSSISGSLHYLLGKVVGDALVELSPCSIQFIDMDNAISLKEGDVVNLMSPNIFTEDFHLIMPDALVRMFYCKIIGATLQETKRRFNPDVYLQEVFRMSELIYMTMNHWCLLDKETSSYQLNHDPRLSADLDRSYQVPVENTASGAGFLFQWRLDMEQLPLQKIGAFFTLEMLDSLLKPSGIQD